MEQNTEKIKISFFRETRGKILFAAVLLVLLLVLMFFSCPTGTPPDFSNTVSESRRRRWNAPENPHANPFTAHHTGSIDRSVSGCFRCDFAGCHAESAGIARNHRGIFRRRIVRIDRSAFFSAISQLTASGIVCRGNGGGIDHLRTGMETGD